MDNGSIWPWVLTGMGLAWWLGRGGWKVFRRADDPLSQRVDELTLEVVDLRLAMSRLMVGAARLIAQLEREGVEPEYRLPEALGRPVEEGDAAVLHGMLVEKFSQEELDALAFGIGIAPESYGGATRSARALALVQVASRHGQLEELAAAARKARPQARWPRMRLEV